MKWDATMKALTIGGAMIDTIAIIDSSHIERMTMFNADTSYLLLAEGAKTEALEVSTHCGGGAVNTATAMARLGIEVSILAKLGRDRRAEIIIDHLKKEGVSTDHVLRDEEAMTGASVLIASHERNAAIFTYRGANSLLEDDDISPEVFAVDLVHVAGLSNNSAECFPRIVEYAKNHQAFVSANPGVRQLSSRGGTVMDCLGRIDLLAMNRKEAELLVPALVARVGEGGPPLGHGAEEIESPLAHRGLASGGYDLSLRAFFTALLETGLRYAAITDGRAGSFFADGDGVVSHCPAAKSAVAGTAGAGDAFSATLARYLAGERGHEAGLRAATLNAASVVTYVDAQSGLMKHDELEGQLESRHAELPVRSWKM
jgi:ribokinase